MVRWVSTKRCGPIGLDIGNRSIKLMQFNADRTRLLEAARWDFPEAHDDAPQSDAYRQKIVDAIRQIREGRKFRGRDVVLCLNSNDLLVQNIRVPKTPDDQLDALVEQEAARRISYSIAEAEIRYLDAADVRQTDRVMREVILLACHRPVLQRMLDLATQAGLYPVAVDVEPVAMLRCYSRQFRRDADRQRRSMIVHVGASSSVVVIAEGDDALFVKYIDVGGDHMDDAVARHLKMDRLAAVTLRRHNGDRRADRQDPDISRSVQESIRPVVERLASEISLCVRYHSVTFRGQPLGRLVLGGGEASQALVDTLSPKLDLACEMGDPLKSFEANLQTSRRGQWDVVAGLAMKDLGESR